MNHNDEEISFNKIEDNGLLLGIIALAICIAIQTALEKFRRHRIKFLRCHLEKHNKLLPITSNAPYDSPKLYGKEKELTEEQINKRIASIEKKLHPFRQGLQFNGIVGVYGALPMALVVTSAKDGAYSATAIYFAAIVGAPAFWGIIRKPRKMAPSLWWVYHSVGAVILLYLFFGPGLSVLIVDDFVVGKVEEADGAGFRVFMDFRNWPAASIVRRIWLWIAVIEWTRRYPTGCDHFKWWSPEVGFVAKAGITAVLFYAWHGEPHPDIDIDGFLFQYATEKWAGRHLIFLMCLAGLTFITVEKQPDQEQEYNNTREEYARQLEVRPEETYLQYVLRTTISSRYFDRKEWSTDIEAPGITVPP